LAMTNTAIAIAPRASSVPRSSPAIRGVTVARFVVSR
jgi:hypothetical protein